MWTKEDYCTLFTDAVKRSEIIVFGCRCSVRYSGRAESYLDIGDRIVVVKSDQSLLIHQPTGNAPINYMKPSTTHTMFLNNKLILKSTSLQHKETMEVTIERVYFF